MKLSICAALAVLASCSDKTTAHLPFIADDFPRARAEAIARGLPLFVEVSAPW